MIIGIISDTHDRLDMLEKAVRALQERGAEHLIHAGDYTSPFTWRVLRHFTGGFTGVFGNNDGDKVLLRRVFGERIHPQPHVVTLADKRFVVMHEPTTAEALAVSGRYDVVVCGHTHEPVITTFGSTLLINPGEVAGWVTGRSTAVVLNTESGVAERIDL
jgi:putative phosphoesterase